MIRATSVLPLIAACGLALASGCTRAASEGAAPGVAQAGRPAGGDSAPAPRATTRVTPPVPAAATPVALHPLVVVHKSPTCGCCTGWVEHLRKEGFRVEVRDQDNLDPVKTRVGVPPGKGSCHTAEVGGYFVEGHVPAADIRRLLAERPVARGLAVPGMPMGSPGMDMPDGSVQPYAVELVAADGSTTVFARHGDARP